MIRLFTLVLVLYFCHQGSAFARICELGGGIGKANRILYVNGIWNTSTDACVSAEALKAILNEEGVDLSTYSVEFFYNPHDGKIADITELRLQAFLSDKAIKNSKENGGSYATHLGSIYNSLLSGATTCDTYARELNSKYLSADAPAFLTGTAQINRDQTACQRVLDVTNRLTVLISDYASTGKVVTVAHSQGNFYVEAARSLLEFRSAPFQQNIQSVGVAAIAAHPADNRYVTIAQDMALYTAQKINTDLIALLNYTPAAASFRACALNHLCLDLPGMGYEPVNIATATGTLDIQAQIAEESTDALAAYLVGKILDGNRYFFHEFVEVYLSRNIGDSDRVPLARRVTTLIRGALNSLTPQIPITASGSGSVISSDGRVNCSFTLGNPSGVCSFSQTQGSIVLTAAPSISGARISWGGMCSGTSNTCTVGLGSAASSVVVYFSAQQFSLVPNTVGGTYMLEECVHDNFSGLTWEGKTTSGIRGGNQRYTIYNDLRTGDASSYVKYVNDIKLCGYTDWRLPKLTDFFTIDVSKMMDGTAAVDNLWLPNTGVGMHWTSDISTYYNGANVVCDLGGGYIDNGCANIGGKAQLMFVKLVR